VLTLIHPTRAGMTRCRTTVSTRKWASAAPRGTTPLVLFHVKQCARPRRWRARGRHGKRSRSTRAGRPGAGPRKARPVTRRRRRSTACRNRGPRVLSPARRGTSTRPRTALTRSRRRRCHPTQRGRPAPVRRGRPVPARRRHRGRRPIAPSPPAAPLLPAPFRVRTPPLSIPVPPLAHPGRQPAILLLQRIRTTGPVRRRRGARSRPRRRGKVRRRHTTGRQCHTTGRQCHTSGRRRHGVGPCRHRTGRRLCSDPVHPVGRCVARRPTRSVHPPLQRSRSARRARSAPRSLSRQARLSGRPRGRQRHPPRRPRRRAPGLTPARLPRR
jgi:hypothetical protein